MIIIIGTVAKKKKKKKKTHLSETLSFHVCKFFLQQTNCIKDVSNEEYGYITCCFVFFDDASYYITCTMKNINNKKYATNSPE